MAPSRSSFPFDLPAKTATYLRGGLEKPRRRLVKLLKPRAVCAEVGVWKGDFSASLLRHTNPQRLHLIDPWAFEENQPLAWYGGLAAHSQADMDAIYESVTVRFEREIAAGTVFIDRAPSTEALGRLPDSGLDWIYIDGNHLYEFVRDDLAAALPKLRPGGYLACDDYGHAGWWEDGVRRAVDEFVATASVEVVANLGSQFVMRKPVGEPETDAE